MDRMNTISQFATEDPKQLGTQLSKLEQNVVKETADIRSEFELAAVPTDDDFLSPTKTYSIGQCARLDTTLGSPTINLSAPASGLPGEIIIVQRKGTAGFIAVGVNATVNNAPSAPFAAFPFAFVTRIYCDGKNFWS